jgi:hypothetical protein
VSLMGIVFVKFTHAIARVVEGVKIRAGRGATFGMGVAVLFVASLSTSGSRASTSLSRGGRDRKIVAISSFHNSCGYPVVNCAYCLPHGRR